VQLDEFFAAYSRKYNLAENLFSVVQSIVQACVQINSAVRLGALADAYGDAGSINVQGEQQKKNKVFG
jgi:fructose-1,6-bisphosphatase